MNRLLVLKIICWIGVISPLIWLIYNIFNETLSADSAKDIQHFTGQIALRILFVTLLLSPLVYLFKWTIFNKIKRLLGLACFFWACVHIASYFVFELGLDLRLFIDEILERRYLQIGSLAWFGLCILAVTSFKAVSQRLKKHWKTIHNAVYLIATLALIHYYLSLKIKQIEPLIYGAILLILWFIHLYRKLKINAKFINPC